MIKADANILLYCVKFYYLKNFEINCLLKELLTKNNNQYCTLTALVFNIAFDLKYAEYIFDKLTSRHYLNYIIRHTEMHAILKLFVHLCKNYLV